MKSEFASIPFPLPDIKKSPARRLQTRWVSKCGWKLLASLAILFAASGLIAPTTLTAQAAAGTAQLQVLPPLLTLFAGGGTCDGSVLPVSGPAVGAPFCNTAAAVEDSKGNKYIVDSIDNCVYKVNPSGGYSVYAGICSQTGYSGDGGPATDALLAQPMDAVVDANDNLYIADTMNQLIRVVNAKTGIIKIFFYFLLPEGGTGGNLFYPTGLTFDPSGNLYFSTGNYGEVVGKIDTSGNGSVFAGIVPGYHHFPDFSGDGGPATSADLNNPTGLASDAEGNIYIADSNNRRIRRVDTQGIITTVAGGGTGGDGGPATDAAVNPFGVATDLAGDLYVSSPNAVRKVDTTGIISTFITGIGLDFGRVDHNGNLILPAGDPLIRFSPSGQVFTAGTGGVLDFGVQAPNTTSTPLTVTLANSGNATLQFSSISGANFGNGSGIITANFAIAPGGTCTYTTLSPGASCTLNVTFTPSSVGAFHGTITLNSTAPNAPATIQLSGTGGNPATPLAVISPPVLYFDGVIRTTSAAQHAVLTNVGSTTLTINSIGIGGMGTDPLDFAFTTGADSCANSLAPGASCNIYVTFTGYSVRIFQLPFWAWIEVNDNGNGSPHTVGLKGTSVAPPVLNAMLTPSSIDFGSQAHGSRTTKTIVLTNTGTAPLTDIVVWFANGTDMTDFTLANLAQPCPPALPPGGSCSIGVIFQPVSAGSFTGMLRVTDNAAKSPQLAPLTGIGTEEQVQIEPSLLNVYAGNSSSNGPPAAGPAVGAYIGNAGAVVQNLSWAYEPYPFIFSQTYIVDTTYNSVYRVDTDGNLTIYAGVPTTGAGSFSGDNGLANQAMLAQPRDVATDGGGNLYIADSANNRIRVVGPYAPYGIATYAGNGDPGELTAGPKTAVPIGQPNGLTFDPDGNLYFTSGNLVGEIEGSGNISIFAGTTSVQDNGVAGFSGDGGPATSATLSNPQGLASDLAGNIYIADSGNFVVRKVDTNGMISTVAGNHKQGNSGNGGMATDAEINAVGVSTDRAGELYITGGGTNPIRKVNSAGMISTFAGGGSGGASGAASGPALGASLPNAVFARPDRFGSLLIPSGATVFSAGGEGILQFGNQGTGTTSAPAAITLTNTGNGTVEFTSLSDSIFGNGSGAITGDFSIAPGGTCTYTTLDHGASCTINVAFAPQSVGSLTGAITLGTNAQAGNSRVQLSGTGVVQPQAALAPATLTFTVAFGSTSAAQSVTLSNTGNATLTIDSIQIVGANPSNFAITTGSNACGTTLTAGSTCNIYVDFTPSSVAGFAASLSVTDNASGSPHTVGLKGTSVAPQVPHAVLTPSSIDFGSQPRGSSTTKTIVLTNTGTETLTIDSIQIVGANPSNFAIATGSNACGTTLTASSTCNIYVDFTPSSVAGFAATLSVADNASGSPHTASLTGMGTTPPDFAISAAPALATIAKGSGGSYTITIAPTGSGFSSAVALSISGLPPGVTGTFSPQSVTPSSGSVASQLTVKVPARSALNRSPWFLAGPALALFLLWPMRRLRRFWRGSLLPLMIVAAGLAASVLMSGCGGGPGSTTPRSTTYALTITGTSGTDLHSTTVQLVIP